MLDDSGWKQEKEIKKLMCLIRMINMKLPTCFSKETSTFIHDILKEINLCGNTIKFEKNNLRAMVL